ncbi:SDR family oxidoreductase [soil metagenome]
MTDGRASQTVLVTGATGFLGGELVRQLLAEGAEVRILRRRNSQLDLLGYAASQVDHAIGDITNPEAVNAACTGVNQVYHLAARVGFGGKREEQVLFDVNARGTANVVNAALRNGVGRAVFTSSIAALGRSTTPVALIDETAEWRQSKANTAYARSKHAAELEVHRGVAEGLDALMVCPALIFGPGRTGDNTTKIVGKVRKEKLPFYPAGGTCVVDVADVAIGHRLAMKSGQTGQRYIFGGENLSWEEILVTLADALDVAPPRWRMPPGLALAAAAASEAAATILRREPLLTRETAMTSSHFHRYSSQRAEDELGYHYRPFSETAARIAAELNQSA